jgi:hypothetical protein
MPLSDDAIERLSKELSYFKDRDQRISVIRNWLAERWYQLIGKECQHKWQPCSFRFETQLLDREGRVVIRQPELHNARVYCVCMKCRSWTYIEAHDIRYFLGGPTELLDQKMVENAWDELDKEATNAAE